MSEDTVEDLIKEITRLRIENNRLEAENNTLNQRIASLLSAPIDERVYNGGYVVRDRVLIERPSCPGLNRLPNNTTDSIGTIFRINLLWVYIKTDSGVKVQRYRKNMKLLSKNDE